MEPFTDGQRIAEQFLHSQPNQQSASRIWAPDELIKAEASKRIDELQAETGRGAH